MSLSGTVSEINADFSRNHKSPTPGALNNSVSPLRVEKHNSDDNIFGHLDKIHKRDGQTDRQTDRRMNRDGQTAGDSRDRAYAQRRAAKSGPNLWGGQNSGGHGSPVSAVRLLGQPRQLHPLFFIALPLPKVA